MATLYGICAVVGGTVLLCQFVMTLMGLADADAMPDDLPHDILHDFHTGEHAAGHGDAQHHSSTWFFGVISFRTVVAALTFFGLTGLAARSTETVSPLAGFALAVLAGAGALYGVHWLMQGLFMLRADGTARIDRAVGRTGTVYIKIPGRKAAAGKIQLNLQNRTMEIEALTDEEELPTGARVVVVEVINSDTVVVQRAPETEEVAHV